MPVGIILLFVSDQQTGKTLDEVFNCKKRVGWKIKIVYPEK